MSARSDRRTQAERRAATRAKILDAARELFAANGYDGCSVDAILERAGSSKGAFYHHFPDKASLLEALMEEFDAQSVHRAAEWTQGLESTIEIMRVSTRNFLEWCTDPYIRQVVLTDAIAVLGFERWRAIDDRYTLNVLDSLLRTGIEAGELRPVPSTRAVARMIIGATNEAALYVAHAEDPAAARDEMSDAFDLLLESLTVSLAES